MKRILILAFICFLSTAYSRAQQADPHATMKFINLDTTYDFGDVPMGMSAQYRFEFKNEGKDDLVITEAHCAIAGVKIAYPNKPVKHGRKGLITVSVPTQDIGSFKDDVYITSNASSAPYPFLHISGAVIPAGDPGAPPSSSAPKSAKRAARGNQ
jgi:hypothetical protein